MGDLKITCSSLCGCVGGGREEEEVNLGSPKAGKEMALPKRLPARAKPWCERYTAGPQPGHLLMKLLHGDKGEMQESEHRAIWMVQLLRVTPSYWLALCSKRGNREYSVSFDL